MEDKLVSALRRRAGRATIGDLVVDTGLPAELAEQQVRRLLNTYTSHLEVDEQGEILYVFEPGLTRRGSGESFRRTVRRLRRWSWKAFKLAFKITIMVTLVVYFILFVVLIIAAFVAMASNNRSSDSRRGGGLPIFWITRVFYVPSGSDYGSSRGSFGQDEDDAPKEPFYKRLFAYVFGPEANDDEEVDPFATEKDVLALIRANKGLVTVPEVVAQTGWDRPRAEQETARLLAAYDGDVRVTSNGTLLYTFERIAVSAAQGRAARPQPAWDRYERPQELTGNTSGTNALITFINGFNLVAALIAPVFIMPQLGLEGPLWWVTLSAFPFLFSLVFFAVPALRILTVWAENSRRAARNAWRFALAEVFRRAERKEEVFPNDVVKSIARNYPADGAGKADNSLSHKAIDRLVRDFEPEIESTAGGELHYRFTALHQELDEGRRARDLIDDKQLQLGKIVFSSRDDDLGLDQLEDFDRQVSGEPAEVDANRLRQLDQNLDAFDGALAGAQAPADEATQARMDDFERRLREGAPAEVPEEAGSGANGRRRGGS